ncbi:MAG: PGF-pre-PGF domain-containing protein, partial [Methanohalobium sp.]|uniref:PGF-pre-PGF domain-containing protein n=1 Tax=Methanohalobium sp. TaxID=2837493 RepID=UPI00397C3B8C
NHKNLENENIDEATITFSAEKSWLEENNKDPSDVGVKRFHNEDWDNIEVNQFDENDTHYVYKAKTPGFSYYSIYLKSTDEEGTGGTSEGSDDTKEPSDDTKEPSDETDQTSDDKDGIPGLTIFGVVALIALVAVTAVIALKRQQK